MKTQAIIAHNIKIEKMNLLNNEIDVDDKKAPMVRAIIRNIRRKTAYCEPSHLQVLHAF